MDNPIQAFLAWLTTKVMLGADILAEELGGPAEQIIKAQVRFAEAERGQAGAGGLIRLVIGIAVAVIVAVGVSIPIVNDVIAQSNLTGLTALIVGFIPVMLGVLIFVATVSPIMNRA